MSFTQVKCSWILPSYVKEVEYSRVRDINFTSAKKMKTDLDATLERVLDVSQVDNLAEKRMVLVNCKLIAESWKTVSKLESNKKNSPG